MSSANCAGRRALGSRASIPRSWPRPSVIRDSCRQQRAIPMLIDSNGLPLASLPTRTVGRGARNLLGTAGGNGSIPIHAIDVCLVVAWGLGFCTRTPVPSGPELPPVAAVSESAPPVASAASAKVLAPAAGSPKFPVPPTLAKLPIVRRQVYGCVPDRAAALILTSREPATVAASRHPFASSPSSVHSSGRNGFDSIRASRASRSTSSLPVHA